MTKALITQSNYIPWKGYFDAINTVDKFIVYDDMQYTKRDWRNRNKIKTTQGTSWLTVPVEVKGKYFQKINETCVSDVQWAKKHWLMIQQHYKKAPFFNKYSEIIEALYLGSDTLMLSEINVAFIKAINKILNIKTEILLSSQFELSDGKTERLVDLCQKIGANEYYSGPAAKNYMEESLFAKHGIAVKYFDYTGYPKYHQLYDGFEHNVTILDLIFNEGDRATSYMKSFI